MVKADSKLGGLNIILIGIISVLYILLVTKLAEMMSLSYENSENQISVYVTIIYFISIMGMIVGYAYLSSVKSNEDTKTGYACNSADVCCAAKTISGTNWLLWGVLGVAGIFVGINLFKNKR